MKTPILSILFVIASGLTLTYGQEVKIISTTWWTDVKDFDEFLKKSEIVLSDLRGSSTFEFRKTGDLTFWTDRRSEFDTANNLIEELVSPYYGTYELKGKLLKIQFDNLKPKILTYKFKIIKGEIRLTKRNI
jgi:hypothetical protein